MARSDLARRVLVAALGIPAGVGVILLGGWPLTVVVAAVGVAGTAEVYGLAGRRGWRPFYWIGLPAALALVGWAGVAGSLEGWAPAAMAILVALTLASVATGVFRRGAEGDPLVAGAATLLGVTYAAAPMAFALLLRAYPDGRVGGIGGVGAYLLMFPLVVTWLGDSTAYFTGRSLGRRKLLPAVSPAKTAEGGLGGLAGAVVGAVAFAYFFLGPSEALTLPLGAAAVLGLCIGVLAQVGDLAESVLKREAGVKDSGSMLPGHGGVLDRFDAVYFTIPLTYALLPFALR